MKLIAAIAVLTVAVIAGGWLGGLYLMLEKPPKRLNWPGILHGAVGAAGVALTLAVLSAPPEAHAVRMGAGGFAKVAAILLCGALAAGLTILLTHLRRRSVSKSLVAAHGMLAITGYTLLVTYLTMLH